MNTEQERADFEAWYEWEYSEAMPCGYSPHGYYLDARIQLLFRCWQAGRAALQSHKPNVEFEDPRVQTVYGIICGGHEPPEGEHWDGYVSRLIVDALQSQDREDAERYRTLVASGKFVPATLSSSCLWGLRTSGTKATKAELDAAIDHARRIEGEK